MAWLFIPSWMIIYVFWTWPHRPKKYVSDDSMRRRELERMEYVEKRNKILNKICCYCFTSDNGSNYNHMMNGHNGHNSDAIIIQQEHRSSVYKYDADNRLIDDMSINNQVDNVENINIENRHRASLAHYTLDQNNGDDYQHAMYNKQISDDYNDSSSSIDESDSMPKSDIWEQHITTEHVALSGSIAQQKLSQTHLHHHI